MKLLFLTVMPSPYQRELFARLRDWQGVSIEVLYFTNMSSDREWRNPSLSAFEEVMPGTTIQSLGNSAHWNPSIISRIKAAKADLVIVSDYSAPTAQLAMRYLAWAGHSFMFWGELPGFSTRGRLGSWVRTQLQAPLRSADAIAAIGKVAEEAYAGLFPGKAIFNIPYFCELSSFQSASASQEQRGDDVTILFSGQLIDRKGVDVLLRAFIEAAKGNPKLRLRLLGSGPERDRYFGMIPDALSDRIEFVGHRDPSELPAEFAKADIFCLPSRHDGWGVVVNEALGAGLPILVSDAVGAGHDLVEEGLNGFVTPVGDASALANGIVKLADDDALRRSMAAHSAQLATRWSLDEGARRWHEAAMSVLQSEPTR